MVLFQVSVSLQDGGGRGFLSVWLSVSGIILYPRYMDVVSSMVS